MSAISYETCAESMCSRVVQSPNLSVVLGWLVRLDCKPVEYEIMLSMDHIGCSTPNESRE